MLYIIRNIYKLTTILLIGFIITLVIHQFIPQQRVDFGNSYLLHIVLDTVLIGIMLMFIWHGNLRINFQLDLKCKWETKPFKRLALQILINTFYSAVVIIILTLLYGLLLSTFVYDYTTKKQISETFPVLQNVSYLFLFTFLFYQLLFICVYFFKRWSESIVESERLKRENLSSRLRALQNQVNPHFLFNNLNSLVTLIAEDKNRAIKFVEELANVYRYLLQQQDEHLVRILEELKFINSYIYLQQTRSGSNLKTEINVDKKYNDYFIAPQTLQILVENAIKHNIISSDKPLTIKIYSTAESIVVENNLQKKLSTQAHTGIGLQNIKDRYRILGYKGIEVDDTNNHFKVTVPIINPGNVNESFNH
jgi:sensor histidine kinase YesM